jgi:dTDP-4-amino-4,6-dideoxygalactose transaminase
VSKAECKFAEYLGAKYCLGVSSGGSAMFIALKTILNMNSANPSQNKEAIIEKERDKMVLTNAYTLSPVPGSIVHAGGIPVLVDCTLESGQSISLDDLKVKHKKTGAKYLLLSYMRGKIPNNLEQILEFVREKNITLIEDCAHTLGAKFKGQNLGTLGKIGCFSFQTNKLINAGEGGAIVTSDDFVISKSILYSGSYGHYTQHRSRPCETESNLLSEEYFYTPNFSLRMNNLTGALVYHQLDILTERIACFNRHYDIIVSELNENIKNKDIYIAMSPDGYEAVYTSFQFNVTKRHEYEDLEALS